MFTRIRKAIRRYKYRQDRENGRRIYEILRRFNHPSMRKDFTIELMLDMDWSIEELEMLSNMLGQEAHDRSRREYASEHELRGESVPST